MNILLVLIPVTLMVIAIAVALFFWAVNHQQFDDLDNPGVLPLLDDAPPVAAPAASDLQAATDGTPGQSASESPSPAEPSVSSSRREPPAG